MTRGLQAVLLAGGLGTRISEETGARPKPMIEIGGKPILWHIMKIYSAFGVRDFVVCLGYKGYVIKEYFANYFLHTSDVTLDLRRDKVTVHKKGGEPWRVTLVDTGPETLTGGRLKRVRGHLGRGPFFMTYGDGLADVDLKALLAAHRSAKALATLTAVRAPTRFGVLDLAGGKVRRFKEKMPQDAGWINGGFAVLEPRALDYIAGDDTPWETTPVERLAQEGRLAAYKHDGFWLPMDTLRDKNRLEELWASGRAPWKTWK
ncbi:MAG: glucose-1-phosphate cytidylyltransferase [Elusimicrobia bacterium]|nr:glucose-1-phosphate cytidylyltransferase [Elusimicrobiota bacterium]